MGTLLKFHDFLNSHRITVSHSHGRSEANSKLKKWQTEPTGDGERCWPRRVCADQSEQTGYLGGGP